MGIDTDFGRAFAKAQLGAISGLPTKGTVFVSVANRDKRAIIFPVKRLVDLGFRIVSHRRAPQTCCGATRSRPRSCSSTPSAAPREPLDRRPDQRRRDRHGRQQPERPERVGAGRRLRHPRGDHERWTSRSSPRCSSSRAAVQAIEAVITGDLDVTLAAGPRGRPRPLRRGGHGVSGVVQVSGELIATRRVGAYHHLTLVAPGVAELARPGQFVALAVGGPTSAQPAAPLLLDPQGQARRAPTAAPSTSSSPRTARARVWLTGLRAHDPVDVVGPLGRPFPLPAEPVACVLVGGGYGVGAAVLAGRGAARARLPRRDGARRGQRGPAVRGASRPGAPPTASPSPPTTAPPGAAAG